MNRASLAGLFEDEQPVTVVVNIKDEIPDKTLSMGDRIRRWLALSPDHVYIGRGSIWGNPFSHLLNSAAKWRVATREEAIEKYREYLLNSPELLGRIEELRGKVLGCWCKPKSCHGDVLIEVLNGKASKE